MSRGVGSRESEVEAVALPQFRAPRRFWSRCRALTRSAAQLVSVLAERTVVPVQVDRLNVGRHPIEERDPAKRLAFYEAAGRLSIDDAPGVFLSHPVFLFLV